MYNRDKALKSPFLIKALIPALLCLGACSPTPGQVSGKAVDANFKLADAIRIYSCAVEKESASDKKAKLQEGLNIHRFFANNEEGWNADINKDRNLQYRILNGVATQYDCF